MRQGNTVFLSANIFYLKGKIPDIKHSLTIVAEQRGGVDN
jgi:hypothetical protein